MPYGGGRRGKGGFQIPLGPLARCPNQRALWQVCKEMVEDTIRKRIGSNAADEDDDLVPPSSSNSHDAHGSHG